MTKLLYLEDTYLFTGSAYIQEIGANEHGTYIILDQTIFYPQWWGQPSDTGSISSRNSRFQVESVRIDEIGIVYHYGQCLSGAFQKWETVSLKIDPARRIENAKNHSAGHLIDVAMKNIGMNSVHATKGYHFPQWPYVEYAWILGESESVVSEKLEQELARLIQQDIRVEVTLDTSQDIKAPMWKTPRYVKYDGYDGCGCGGTHVQNSGEIGHIHIKKIKSKDGMIRVSYQVG